MTLLHPLSQVDELVIIERLSFYEEDLHVKRNEAVKGKTSWLASPHSGFGTLGFVVVS